ncbi:hypothetical protein SEMRO_2862_G338830.1 [Seminavis robusta]|uniref:Uncharacterized protein n=1 Tax=Seminavis robusta TaxID=568900 RepID=A0A9N8EYE1_9STRA|nr:hypothetical protein SEMRO_2862_G338830.1 [Seminavis robusta]|eukprot:Sro2862_g338830.1 n/a (445) ;mRNA; f:7116-8450
MNFKPNGPHAANMVRWFIKQALAAKALDTSPSDGDYSWETFLSENEVLVQTIAGDHPGPDNDHTKLVRANFHRQVTRFKNWLCSPGYTSSFQREAGLTDSGLAGSCANNPQQPGDLGEDDPEGAPEEPNPDPDIPFAGPPDVEEPEPPKKPAKKPAKKQQPKTTEENLEDLYGAFESLDLDLTETDMKLKMFSLEGVKIRGGVVKMCNILGVQIRVPPGAVLSTLHIQPSYQDPNQVDVECDIAPELSKGSSLCKQRWKDQNADLAARIATQLGDVCWMDTAAGVDYEKEEVSVSWPDGRKSELVALDPWALGLRERPVRDHQSLYEIDHIASTGSGATVAPSYVVTVFFKEDKPRQFRGKSGGLRIDGSWDECDDDDYHDYDNFVGGGGRAKKPRTTPKKGSGGDDDDVDMDGGKSSTPKKRAATPKKPPASSYFGFMSFLFG